MAKKKQKPALEQRVYRFIRENKLINPGQKVLVAVSGGPDSVCLLHTLYQLQTELNITLHIAHLNHQLRGEESEADAQYVADLARNLKYTGYHRKAGRSRLSIRTPPFSGRGSSRGAI